MSPWMGGGPAHPSQVAGTEIPGQSGRGHGGALGGCAAVAVRATRWWSWAYFFGAFSGSLSRSITFWIVPLASLRASSADLAPFMPFSMARPTASDTSQG